MKRNQIATRIIAGVLPAMALFATPVSAQELQTQTAPPPVPSAAAPAPAPVAAAPSGATGTVSQAQYEASVRAATGSTAAADAPAARTAPTRAATARTAPRRAPAAAPVAAAPVAAAPVATAPAPVAAEPVATTPAAPVAATPVEPIAEPTATTTQTDATTTTESGFPTWGWLLAGLAAIAAIAGAVIALRRRREANEWAEEAVYYDEAPVAAEHAVAAAPLVQDEVVVEEHADLVAPEAAEVAAITDAAAPVAGRPWIELSLRPVRAGATDESALVDLELTLANAGELAAEDVRVSTFMLGDAAVAPTEMDRLLATGHAGAEVEAGAIGAGEGSRVDARLAMPRDGLEGATFQPVVVADVRYRLPDGSEGRTAAAFTIGVDDDGAEPGLLRLSGDMREDVTAALHGVPERA